MPDIFFITSCVFGSIIGLYWIKKYAKPEIPLFFKILTWGSWLSCFLMLSLLPIDLGVTATLRCEADPQTSTSDCERLQAAVSFSYEEVQLAWKILYWLTTILGWIGIPLSQSYHMSGHITIIRKLLGTIIDNIRTYLLLGIAAVALVIWIKASYNFGSSSAVVVVLICINNATSLALLMLILGYGLVEVPRKFWTQADYAKRLKSLYSRACIVNDRKEESRARLATTIEELAGYEHALDPKVADPFLISTLKLVKRAVPENTNVHKGLCFHDLIPEMPKVVQYKNLANLHRKIKKRVLEQNRWECLWDELMREVFWIEDIDKAVKSGRYAFVSSLSDNPSSKIVAVTQYCWFVWFRPTQLKILCFLSVLASLFILGVEFTLIFSGTPSGRFMVDFVRRKRHETYNGTMFQTLLFLPVLYLLYCLFFTIFRMKLGKYYQCFDHRQTDGSSLLYSAYFILRFTPGLCLNTLLLLHETAINRDEPIQKTAFSSTVNTIDVGPLPDLEYAFTVAAPIILFICMIMFLFHIFGRIMALLGINRYESEETFDENAVEEGRDLIEREKNFWLRKVFHQRPNSVSHEVSPFTYDADGNIDTASISSSSVKVRKGKLRNNEEPESEKLNKSESSSHKTTQKTFHSNDKNNNNNNTNNIPSSSHPQLSLKKNEKNNITQSRNLAADKIKEKMAQRSNNNVNDNINNNNSRSKVEPIKAKSPSKTVVINLREDIEFDL